MSETLRMINALSDAEVLHRKHMKQLRANHQSEITRITKANAELREALAPFEAFAGTCQRMLRMDPDHKITQGSPMAAPQLYARDFLVLLDALANSSEGE